MSNEIATLLSSFNNEELAARREDEYGFLAQLVLEVLINMLQPRPWRKVAELAVYEYERSRDKYLDDPVDGKLLIPSDRWVKESRINSTQGRQRISAVIEELGYYIARPPGEGIYLTKDKSVIEEDYAKNGKAVKSRADRLSYRAVKTNKRLGTELPIAAVQFLPASE